MPQSCTIKERVGPCRESLRSHSSSGTMMWGKALGGHHRSPGSGGPEMRGFATGNREELITRRGQRNCHSQPRGFL